jgi:hypothetical protein
MPAKRTKVDRAVQQAAETISEALTKLLAELPVGSSPDMVLEDLVEQLAGLEAFQMIMESPDIMEAYCSTVAELRATAKQRA